MRNSTSMGNYYCRYCFNRKMLEIERMCACVCYYKPWCIVQYVHVSLKDYIHKLFAIHTSSHTSFPPTHTHGLFAIHLLIQTTSTHPNTLNHLLNHSLMSFLQSTRDPDHTHTHTHSTWLGDGFKSRLADISGGCTIADMFGGCLCDLR